MDGVFLQRKPQPSDARVYCKKLKAHSLLATKSHEQRDFAEKERVKPISCHQKPQPQWSYPQLSDSTKGLCRTGTTRSDEHGIVSETEIVRVLFEQAFSSIKFSLDYYKNPPDSGSDFAIPNANPLESRPLMLFSPDSFHAKQQYTPTQSANTSSTVLHILPWFRTILSPALWWSSSRATWTLIL